MAVEKKEGSPEILLILLLIISVQLMLMAGYRAARTYFLMGEFVVRASYLECQPTKWQGQSCVRHYSVRIPDGTVMDFIPFYDEFNDGALHDGATFAKGERGFNYEVNGVYERWPFLSKAIGMFLVGCLGLVLFVACSGPRYLGWTWLAKKTTPSKRSSNAESLTSPPTRRRRWRSGRRSR